MHAARTQTAPPSTEACLTAVGEVITRVRGELQLRLQDIRVLYNYRIEQCEPREAHVVNMCGRILHYRSDRLIKPAVLSFARDRRSSFGVYKCFYTLACNFHIDTTLHNTVFRAGRSSRDVLATIDHILEADSVRNVRLHLLVFAAHTGQPICLQNSVLLDALSSFPCWEVRPYYSLDLASARGIALEKVTPDAMTRAGLISSTVETDNSSPLRVFINIMRTGSVTFFFSMPRNTLLHEGIENQYLHLTRFIMKVVTFYS